MSESTALATVDVNQYAIMREGDIEELMETITENLGGKGLSLSNLTRIKIPAGGGTVWQVPTADGEKNVETLRGLLIYQHPRRVYYSKPMGEGEDSNARPDCSSQDAVVGYGFRNAADIATNDSQHDCATCPLAQWGPNRERPACRERHNVFLLREDDMLPAIIDLPSTSVRPLKNFLSQLTVEGTRYIYAMVEITLNKTPKEGARQAFSTAVFKKIDVVPKESRLDIKKYHDAIKVLVTQPAPDVAAQVVSQVPVGEMEEIEL